VKEWIEWNHGLDQYRLVKELRLAGISAIVAANRFLEETYLPKINGKFCRPIADPADAHVPLTVDMKGILCFEHERTVIMIMQSCLNATGFRSSRPIRSCPGSNKVIVRIRLDGSLSILWKEKIRLVEEISIPKKVNQTFMLPEEEVISIAS
jgi:hypothetical protein